MTLRHVRLVARTELRRTWRGMRGSARGVLILIALGLFLPLYGLVAGGGAYFLGTELQDGGGLSTTLFRGVLAAVPLGTGAMILQRTIKRIGEPPAADGLLTTTGYATVLWGLLLAEFGRLLGSAGLLVAGAAIGFALGTGSALAGLALCVLLLALVVLGLLLGYAGGLLVKYVVGRSAFVSKHRGALGIGSSITLPVAYFVAISLPEAQRVALRFIEATPAAWLADPVLLVTPGPAGRVARAVGAVLAVVLAIPVAGVATHRLAERVWYMDPVQVDHEFDPDATPLSDRLLGGVLARQTRVVAQKSWRRARRSPFTVQFAIFPLFFLLFEVQTVVFEGRVPDRLPVLVGLATATAAGAAFTLNPLGGEDDVLPAVLTARISGRRFLTGLAIAGAAPGLAVGVALVVALGLVAGLGPAALSLALATTLLATLSAPAVASGWGVVFPKFESSEVQGREVVVPSGWAFGFYLVTVGVAWLPALVTQLPAVRGFVRQYVGSGLALALGGLAVSAVLAALLGGVSFLAAARRVGTYRLQ